MNVKYEVRLQGEDFSTTVLSIPLNTLQEALGFIERNYSHRKDQCTIAEIVAINAPAPFTWIRREF